MEVCQKVSVSAPGQPVQISLPLLSLTGETLLEK